MIMNIQEYRAKVLGCWLAKNIGGTLGAPFEWKRQLNDVSFYTQDPGGDPLPNDHLNIQLLWLIALEEKGIEIDAKTLADYWVLYENLHCTVHRFDLLSVAVDYVDGPTIRNQTPKTIRLRLRNTCRTAANIACGQACPCGAIPPLELERKRQAAMGGAVVDRNRCLPWAYGAPCIVCEEMCPVPDKAVRVGLAAVADDQGQEVTLQWPTVLQSRRIGCGICQHQCPVQGADRRARRR